MSDPCTLSVDCSAEASFPTLKHCERYGIAHFATLVRGPGGGNPAYTLTFAPRTLARRWLALVYFKGLDPVPEDFSDILEKTP